MLRYIPLHCGILNLPKIELDQILHYLTKCTVPCSEAIEFIAGVLPINDNNIHILLRHHRLTLTALYTLMSRIPNEKIYRYNRESYMPILKHLIKPFITCVAKVIGVDKLCDMFKFIYPELSKAKLSDLRNVFFKPDSHHLDEASLRYYLHNDTNYSLICDIYQNSDYRHQLEEIIPKLTPNTPCIDRILIILIEIGLDVKKLAVNTKVDNGILTLDQAFLLVYLCGIESLDRFDIDINSELSFDLWSEYNDSCSQEYKDLCDVMKTYLGNRYSLHYDID